MENETHLVPRIAPAALRPRPTAVIGLLLAMAAGSGSPAAADWLVTREGSRVETRGTWEVKGKLVVFTGRDGTLASLRASEVDLEASRQATAAAVEAAAAAKAAAASPPPRKKSVLILTDKELPPVASADDADDADGPAVEAAAAPADQAAASDIVVSSWERSEDQSTEHVVVSGTVTNNGRANATNVQLTVLLYDEDGKLLVSGDAVLTANALPPGQSSGFRAEFPGTFSFAAVKFEPKSLSFEVRPEAAPSPGTGG